MYILLETKMATTNVLEQRFKLKDVLERIKLKNQMEEGNYEVK